MERLLALVPCLGFVGIILLFLMFSSVRVVQEYERGVIFRLGRSVGAKGPGLFFICARWTGGPRVAGSRAHGMTPPRTPYVDYDVLGEMGHAIVGRPDARGHSQAADRDTRAAVSSPRPSGRRWNPICARLVPQPERSNPIPIAPWIDEKLHHDRRDGFRYDDMPPLARGVAARPRGNRPGKSSPVRRRVPVAFRGRSGRGAQNHPSRRCSTAESGTRLPAQRFFTTVLLKEVVGEYLRASCRVERGGIRRTRLAARVCAPGSEPARSMGGAGTRRRESHRE